MRYETRYVHKISPSDKDVGKPVDVEPADLTSRTKLAAALRNAGVLSRGDTIKSFRFEDDRIIVFPQASIWHSIVLHLPGTEALPKRAHATIRASKSPKITGDTRVKIPSSTGTGYEREFILRPAQVKVDYGQGPLASAGSREKYTAYTAKRSMGEWFVMTPSGHYIGILSEGSGDEPWAVQRLERGEVGVVGKDGVEVSRSLRTAPSWQEAIARSWWA